MMGARHITLALAVSATTATAQSGPEYGAYLSAQCTTCHQVDATDAIPAIHGMTHQAFCDAMLAYRSGAREHPIMQMIASQLSNDDIAALAAHFRNVD